MDSRGEAPRPSTVQEMTNIIFAARGITRVNWANFVNHRDELRTRFSRHYDYQRALIEDPISLREWFTAIKRVIDENGIQPEDIYKFDETGFTTGFIPAQKVVTRAEYYGRRSVLQTGNREWVTVIEAICADGYALSLCVIFRGKAYIDCWFDSLPGD